MAEYFDIRTLSLITSVVAISCFSVMFYVAIKRKIYPGFIEWTVAYLLNSVGMVLLALRDVLPDFFSIIIANSFILLYFIFSTRGLQRFSGTSQKNWIDISVLVFLIISFGIFTYILPNITIRIFIISGFFILFCCRICFIILVKLPKVLPNKQTFLFIIFAFFGGWYLLRIILTILFENQIDDFMQAGIIQGLAFLILIATNIITSALLIICNTQRLETDLFQAKEEIKVLSGFLPICSHCKKIRDDDDDWVNIEEYISTHSEALFSHGICPDCTKRFYSEFD